MSNLSGLLYEQTKLTERINQSIIDADADLNSKLEKSRAELERRIFFERTADYRERLADSERERAVAVEVRDDLTNELKAQAEKVMEARSKAFDEAEKHNQIQSKLHFLDNTIEQARQTTNQLKAELAAHLKQKLYGGNDE